MMPHRKWKTMITYLTAFHPDFAKKTAESLVKELTSFSLTVERSVDGIKRRIWSNFSPIIRR